VSEYHARVDGAAIVLLIVAFGGLALVAGGGRARREDFLTRRTRARIDDQLYRTTTTDATGMVVCRRCGTEGSERAGTCRRCGAGL
jgi:hypothetical protein